MISIKNAKTNTVPDWTQPQLDIIIAGGPAPLPPSGTLLADVTLPSDWNADLVTSMATNKLLGRGTASTGVFEEITLGTGLSLTGTTLNASGSGSPGGADTNVQFNNMGAFDGDPGFTYDGAGTANLSVKLQTNAINYNTAINASGIDLSNTFLLDTAGDKTMLWNARILYFTGGVIQSLNWDLGQAYDPSTILSIDWLNRGFYDNIGAISHDYNARKLYEHFGALNIDYSFAAGVYLSGILDTGGGLVIDPTARKLWDSGTINSLDWEVRLAKAPDSSLVIDWTNTYNATSALSFGGGNAYFATGINSFTSHNLSIDPNARILCGGDGISTLIDYKDTINSGAAISFQAGLVAFGQQIIDQTSTPSVDTNNRILYASDGITPIINWTGGGGSADLSFVVGDRAFIAHKLLIGDLIVDNSGSYLPTIDPTGRLLYASDGTTNLFDWTNGGTSPANYYFTLGILQGNGSGLTGITAANANYLYDTAGTPLLSVDGVNRALYNVNGDLIAGWGAGTTGIYFNFDIQDSTNKSSVSSESRRLYAVDGATTLLDWSGAIINMPTGAIAGGLLLNGNPSVPSGTGDTLHQGVSGYAFSQAYNFNTNTHFQYDIDGAPLVLNTNSGGNVGIGVTVPMYKLDVLGDINFTGDLYKSGSLYAPKVAALYKNNLTTQVIDGEAQTLIAAASGLMLDWTDTYPHTSILELGAAGTWTNQIIDAANVASINANTRALYAADGTSVELDYSGAYNAAAILCFDSGFPVFNASIRDYTSFVASIDSNSRYLYASDGTTILVDWSNSTAAGSYNFLSGKIAGDGSKLINLDPANITGYPGSAAFFLNGAGGWTLPTELSDGASHNFVLDPTGYFRPDASNDRVSSQDKSNYIENSGFTGAALDIGSGALQADVGGVVSNANIQALSFTGDGSMLVALDPANITGYTTSVNDVLHGNSSWGPVDLAAGVTGVLPVANGGTGQATPVVIAGSFSQAVVAATTVTVTLPATQANNTYKLNITPTALLSTAAYYISAKTTTTFTVTYGTALTGTVAFDWALFT